MALSVEDLNKPRFKVIADYPENPFSIGQVLQLRIFGANHAYCDIYGHYSKDIKFFNKYSHLFKKLDWWVDRKIEDMPEYIIGKHAGEENYIKVDKWIMGDAGYPITISDGVTYYAPYSKPISKEEYETFINTLK